MDGILVTLIGLGVVFFVLICLIGAIMLMSKGLSFVKAVPAKAASAQAPAAPAPSAAMDAATLAAISASIATVMNKEVSGLKIVSIKRV